MQTFVFFATIVAMGSVGFEDVAVTGFEETEDDGFVDYAGAVVVGNGIKVDAVVQ